MKMSPNSTGMVTSSRRAMNLVKGFDQSVQIRIRVVEGARRAPPVATPFSAAIGIECQEAGGLRKPPNSPGKYSNAPDRPMWSGCFASH